jgi:hypothetical protein
VLVEGLGWGSRHVLQRCESVGAGAHVTYSVTHHSPSSSRGNASGSTELARYRCPVGHGSNGYGPPSLKQSSNVASGMHGRPRSGSPAELLPVLMLAIAEWLPRSLREFSPYLDTSQRGEAEQRRRSSNYEMADRSIDVQPEPPHA